MIPVELYLVGLFGFSQHFNEKESQSSLRILYLCYRLGSQRADSEMKLSRQVVSLG